MHRSLRKSRFALLLVLLLAVLVACETTGTTDGEEEGGSTLEVVQDRGQLIVGVRHDTPPFGFLTEEEEVEGIDIEISEYIAERLGVEVEFREVTAETRLPALQQGEVDMLAAALAVTREREEEIDYTLPYVESFTRYLVLEDSGIQGTEDLDGKTVAVVAGTLYPERLEETQPGANVQVLQEYPQAVTSLRRGRADAIMTGEDILLGLVELDERFEIVGDPLEFPSFTVALAVRENDSAWRDFINFSIIDMWEEGALQEAYEGAFGQSPPEQFRMPTWEL